VDIKAKITVLIAVYNGDKYLEAALNSIQIQNYSNWECIIIDDGSTDDSFIIAQKFAKFDKRFALLKNEKNYGLARSLNKALSLSKGLYIARQDADDVSEAMRFERFIHFVNENNHYYDLIGSDCSCIDMDGNHLFSSTNFSHRLTMQNCYSILQNGEQGALFPHGAAFMKAAAIRALGGYNESLYFAQDLDLWFKFCLNDFKIAIIPQTLYSFRLKPIPYSGKNIYKDQVSAIIRSHYSGILTKTEYEYKIIDIMKQREFSVVDSFNPYYLSDYWYYIALSTIKTNDFLKTWLYLNKSLKEKNNAKRVLIRLLSYLIPFFPYRMTVKYKRLVRQYKSAG